MERQSKPENPLLNLLINILLPVIFLNKGAKYADPKLVLLVALALPLGYGIYDYVRCGRKNFVSLLGVFNTLLTGGLAMMEVTGIWFAVKEASLPLVLGLLVLGAAWTNSPAAKVMFCNSSVLNMNLIHERLAMMNKEGAFTKLVRQTTLWLSLSFFISAFLNFVLAWNIFSEIEPSLQPLAREQILNEQIAQMTWMGFAVIAAPLMLFSGTLIYLFLKKVATLTELPLASIMREQ